MSENEETRINRAARNYAILMMATESPIEKKLAPSLFEALRVRDRPPYVLQRIHPWHTKLGYTIAPQLQIGPYRVDFAVALTLHERDPGGDGIYKLSDAPMVFHAQFAVECDGHDFHEKTKEQAARDKSRDRYLLKCGWPVIRFSGSEIHKDPLSCAAQVAATLEASIETQESSTADVRALARAERNRRGAS